MGNLINTLATVLQIISALGVILLVLLQHGKGADMGAAFGSGASGSLFGATGSANFLSRLTAAMAAVFFVSTLALAFFANERPSSSGSLMEGVGAPTQPASPASSVPSLPGSAPSGSSAPPAGAVPPANTVPPAGTPASPPSGASSGASDGGAAGAASQIPK